MNNKDTFILPSIFIPGFMLVVLIILRLNSSLVLFHTVSELFSIIVGVILFVIAWNTRRFTRNDFLVYLGIGYLGISVLDFCHAFAFKGLPLWSADNLQITLHFWIYSRFFEALILLTAPIFLYKKLNAHLMLGILSTVVALLSWLALNFHQPFLITNEGLTNFKVISEYIIIGLYLIAIIYYLQAAKPLSPQVRSLILLSLILTIFAELSFTLYTDYNGVAFVTGHLIKFLSFWTIYLAIVRTTLNEPFDVLSRVSTSYDAIPQPTLILDNKAKIVQVNRAATDITEISAAELIHHSVHELFHNKDILENNCELCQAIKHGQAIETQTVWSPKLKRWFLISLAPISYGKKSGGMVQSASDITQQKSAEQALRRSQKMDAIGQLTGGIAHDFNNILGIILGNIQLLEMQTSLDEKSLSRFKAIQKATNRATDLTKQLLGFSRGKSQHVNIVNINQLIGEMDNLIARSLTPLIDS